MPVLIRESHGHAWPKISKAFAEACNGGRTFDHREELILEARVGERPSQQWRSIEHVEGSTGHLRGEQCMFECAGGERLRWRVTWGGPILARGLADRAVKALSGALVHASKMPISVGRFVPRGPLDEHHDSALSTTYSFVTEPHTRLEAAFARERIRHGSSVLYFGVVHGGFASA